MKAILTAAAAVVSTFAALPALAQGFSCSGWNAAQEIVMLDAAVIDVGDQEGEVAVYGAGNTRQQYAAYFDGYRTESGEVRQHFIFGADQSLALDLNEKGTAGVFERGGESVKVECKVHDVLGRYAFVAGKAAWGYDTKGEDNNTLGFVTVSQSALALDPEARPVAGQELREALKTCVFMQEGAYGEHLNARVQSELVKSFQDDLRKLASDERNTLKFYRSGKLLADSNTLWAPSCSLIVEVDGQASLALNGTMMD